MFRQPVLGARRKDRWSKTAVLAVRNNLLILLISLIDKSRCHDGELPNLIVGPSPQVGPTCRNDS